VLELKKLEKDYSLIIIDDDPGFTEMTKLVMASRGFDTISFTNPEEAVEHLKTNDYDLILLDYFMPEMNGSEFIDKLREYNKRTPVIIQTGYANEIKPIDFLEGVDAQGFFDKTDGVDPLVLYSLTVLKTAELCKRQDCN